MKPILYLLVTFTVGLALGYFLMPKKEVTKTVEKQVDRVITIIKHPDGTEEKVITDKSKITNKESSKDLIRSKYNLSALIGTDFKAPVYGLHVSKEFIGPITIGGWATAPQTLNNVNVGISLGLNF